MNDDDVLVPRHGLDERWIVGVFSSLFFGLCMVIIKHERVYIYLSFLFKHSRCLVF